MVSGAVFGCGSKGVGVAHAIAAALQGSKADSLNLGGIGVWASYVLGRDVPTEYRAVYDVVDVGEAPTLLLLVRTSPMRAAYFI